MVQAADSGAREPRREPNTAPHSTMSQCPAYKSRGVGPTLPLTPLCLSALPIKGDPPHWFAVKAKEADPSIKPSD